MSRVNYHYPRFDLNFSEINGEQHITIDNLLIYLEQVSDGCETIEHENRVNLKVTEVLRLMRKSIKRMKHA